MNRKVRINLLPPELAGKAGKSRPGRPSSAAPAGPNPLFVLIAIIAFGAAAYGCYGFYAKLQAEKELFNKTQAELAEKEKEVTETREKFKEFIETRDLILALTEVLDAIDPPNRIIWAEKMLMLADLVPENVYITEVAIIEKERQVITEESKRAIADWEKAGSQGTKPEEVKKPIIHQEVTISALARQDATEEPFTYILAFLKAMNDYKTKRQDGSERYFMENFVEQPKYGEIKSTSYDGVGVYEFFLTLTTKPLSAQVTPEQQAAADEMKKAVQSTLTRRPAPKPAATPATP